MPNIFCDRPFNSCPDPSVPTANYSAETPDRIAYFGRAYNPGLQPPLGSNWKSTGCIGTCISTVSQREADLCAARQVITCLAGEWPVEVDNPNDGPGQPPNLLVDRQTFDNDPQSCDFTCPDGEVFTYTIPAGTVRAFSQAAADASAQSMACNGAIDNRICIGELSPATGEVDVDYLATVSISSPRIGQQGSSTTVTIVSGVLPPGLGLDYNETSFTIAGTPTDAGQYSFTIQVVVHQEGFASSFMKKNFSIEISGAVECCMNPLTTIPASIGPNGISYAVQDNRIFTSVQGAGDVLAVDPETNTVIATIPAGDSPAGQVYSPVNNRVYVVNFSNADILVINPDTMTLEATIPAPAGVAFVFCPVYDTTNDLIYITGIKNTFVDYVLVVVDPVAATASILITELEIPGESLSFGNRAEHCPLNNRIYVPYYQTSGGGAVTEIYIRVYDITGAFLSDILIPGATSTFGEEQVHWNPATSKLYYNSYSAVTDLPGVRVINPTTHVTEATILTPSFPAYINFTPDCLSINVLQTDGNLTQYNSGTLAVICTNFVALGVTGATQLAQSANGNEYIPAVTSNVLTVLNADA